MGAAVVLSEQLDVLVVLPPVDLVLDAIVREVDLPIEVGQVVLVGPPADSSSSRSGRPSLSGRPRLCSCRNSWYSRFRSCSRTTR